MAQIKFDESTNYEEVEESCWQMLSALQAKKCSCKPCNSSELSQANSIMWIAIAWEKTNRPDRYVKSMRNVYLLLLSLK